MGAAVDYRLHRLLIREDVKCFLFRITDPCRILHIRMPVMQGRTPPNVPIEIPVYKNVFKKNRPHRVQKNLQRVRCQLERNLSCVMSLGMGIIKKTTKKQKNTGQKQGVPP